MGEFTNIGWCHHTFNPWWICTEVSPACDNCYARELAARFGFGWGHGVPRRTFGEKHWQEPLAWNRKAKAKGQIERTFCASMADIFDEEAPAGQLDKLWPLIDATDSLNWLLLTKRPFGYVSKMPERFLNHPRVWKGITAEDQYFYNLRSRHMALPGIWWVSYEPALGPLTHLGPNPPSWIVCGGESGSHFRPMQQRWATDLEEKCDDLGIKFFMKQWSARTPNEGKLLIPDFLRIQEFPASPLDTQSTGTDTGSESSKSHP